jgi:hypothetical protein
MLCTEGANKIPWDIAKSKTYNGDYRNCDIQKVMCTGDYGGNTTFFTSNAETTCELKEVVCNNKTTEIENIPSKFSPNCHINTLLCGDNKNKYVFTFIPTSNKNQKFCISSSLTCDGRVVNSSPYFYNPSSTSCKVSFSACSSSSPCSFWYNSCINSTYCQYNKYPCIDACLVPVINFLFNFLFFYFYFYIYFYFFFFLFLFIFRFFIFLFSFYFLYLEHKKLL